MSTSSVLNGTTAAISLISAIFFVVGCTGYADQREAVENSSWIYAKDGEAKVWFGLSTVYITRDDIDYKYSMDYGGSSCDGDFCDRCKKDGNAALGLVMTALILTVINTAFSSVLLTSFNSTLQIVNLVAAFLAASMSLIGVGVFMGDCMHELNDQFDNLDLKWGPGSILSILGMLLMWVATIVQVVALIMGGGDSGSPTYKSPSVPPAAIPAEKEENALETM